MSLLQTLLVAGVVGPALMLSTNAVEVATSETLAPRQDYQCVPSKVSDDKEHSFYSFSIDASIKDNVTAAGITHVGVQQYCDSDGTVPMVWGDTGTENWALLLLNTFAPDNYTLIKMDRCKKRFDREVTKYRVHMCTSDKKDSCEPTCGPFRDRCGIEGEKTLKATIMTDLVPWPCAVPVP